MIKLKCSKFINLFLTLGYKLDIQVRQFENQDRVIYLGQGSQVIQISEEDLENVISFLNKAKELKLVEEREGYLK